MGWPLPAKALIITTINDQKDAQWKFVAVSGYDANKKLWQIFPLDDTSRNLSLPRLYVCFSAEDPRIFVKRFAAALRLRNEAEAGLRLYKITFYYLNYDVLFIMKKKKKIIRHGLQLDCMIYDGIVTLNDSQKNKIISLVERGKRNTSTLIVGIIIILYKKKKKN